jgi:hypothetical protein
MMKAARDVTDTLAAGDGKRVGPKHVGDTDESDRLKPEENG